MSSPVPKDAVAIESHTRNYLFFVDESRYIKYYEGPEGGDEGPDSQYSLKSLKYHTKTIRIRVYFAADEDEGVILKELCITDGKFAEAKEGALNKRQGKAQALAPESSISAVNILSSSLLKVFVTLKADTEKLYVWYFPVTDGKVGSWQHAEIELA
ncbi:hypothetical protein SLS60_009379 [Paraconiothyrium brasiliense]|uniref:Fucose-specific lectin n=1 Tax=Paraconiothyrium brasiliense TaxID=300254 RepID=A0ABR3QU42_9PLEO